MELVRQRIWRYILQKLIAHRGNTNGSSVYENEPSYVQSAIDLGYDAEIDVWHADNKLWLGHDKPQYSLEEDFLYKNINSLWIHCKNFDALHYFVEMGNSFNYFWHQEDDYTMTSHNFIWTYPGKIFDKWSVIVDLDLNNIVDYAKIYGICSDRVASLD